MVTNATSRHRSSLATVPSKTNMPDDRPNRDKFLKSRSVADLRCCNTSLAVAYAAGQNALRTTAVRNVPIMRYPDEAMAPLCIPGTEIESTEFKKAKHERFQKLFFNVPSTELLVSKFSCAYVTEKGALLQGHLYVSRNWICFYSNIFGMKKTIELEVSSVKSIKKERTAKIFPNAIGIVVDSGQHYLFGSLISRQNTHQLLTTLLERSRIIRDYCMSATGPSVTLSDLSIPKEFVDASAGDDHGYSTSTEDESFDESYEIRPPHSTRGALTLLPSARTPEERKLKLDGVDLKSSQSVQTYLRRIIGLQLLTTILTAMLLISFVYWLYSSTHGSSHHHRNRGPNGVAKDDLESIDQMSALVMETITSLRQVRSDVTEMRDVLAAL
uniref:GRAM domain-containing protein n=1 Tax=Plectus sambesii TaxID=2011161 RepID=A0A914VMI6_9BILA